MNSVDAAGDVGTTDETLECLKQGTQRHEDGDSYTVWAVFDTREAENWVGIPMTHPDFAENLTGWARFSSGPGRMFGSSPSLRVYRRKLIVSQFRALDI